MSIPILLVHSSPYISCGKGSGWGCWSRIPASLSQRSRIPNYCHWSVYISIPNTVRFLCQYHILRQDFSESRFPSSGQIPYPVKKFCFSTNLALYFCQTPWITYTFSSKVGVSRRLLASPPTIGLSWTTTSRKRPLTLRILCGLVREGRLYQRERMVRYRGCNPWPFFLIHRLFKHYRCGKTPGTCISSEQLWRRCFNRTVARWYHCLLFLEESILILFSLSRGNLTGIRFRTKLSGVFGFVLMYYPLLN